MTTFNVSDMSCAHCVAKITNELKQLDSDVQVDLNTKSVSVSDETKVAKAKELVSELGYTVE